MKDLKSLSVVEYSDLVDTLFNYFFTSDGEFDPAQGEVGCLYKYYLMRCDDPDKAKTLINFHEDLTDEFYDEYYDETNSVYDYHVLSFGSAYRNAYRKVEYITNPTRQIASTLAMGMGLLAKVGEVSNDDKKEEEPNLVA